MEERRRNKYSTCNPWLMTCFNNTSLDLSTSEEIRNGEAVGVVEGSSNERPNKSVFRRSPVLGFAVGVNGDELETSKNALAPLAIAGDSSEKSSSEKSSSSSKKESTFFSFLTSGVPKKEAAESLEAFDFAFGFEEP